MRKLFVDLPSIRLKKAAESKNILEIAQRSKFFEDISSGRIMDNLRVLKTPRPTTSQLTNAQFANVLDSGILTFLLHCEARFASSAGLGFYTIGPCGEELMAAVAQSVRPTDAVALHYRHVSLSVSRQLLSGRSIHEVALDRARGYTCSVEDPITGGRHCAIGGSPTDFLVTSTLASQAPPAVGRALAIALGNRLIGGPKGLKEGCTFPVDAVSLVTVGDGSVNNGHFLSALNMAKYSMHRNFKCPVVFGISDNNRCISLAGHGWINSFTAGSGVKLFTADGFDADAVYSAGRDAIAYSRSLGRPSMLLVNNLPRRFGHAATDRQVAYMTAAEIAQQAELNPLAVACAEAIHRGVLSQAELADRVKHIQSAVETGFNTAVNEDKITSVDTLVSSNSRPVVPHPNSLKHAPVSRYQNGVSLTAPAMKPASASSTVANSAVPDSMRKHMTRVYDEILSNHKDAVYIGEDVEHGGYYLVTEGLAAKHKGRVRDFPPDETSIVGAAMGISQANLLSIVEIPYAKYLDCAGDMLNEAVILNWLSDGKQPCGMLIRLQGFDKGVFGGNFHTHNMINIPPGLDVVCYSNGEDYVRGIRYATRQARNGRVVMSIDSTDLLNRRHLGAFEEGTEEKDDFFLRQYPALEEELSFDQVIVHNISNEGCAGEADAGICIVSYGNGVASSLLAAKQLLTLPSHAHTRVTVIDCPYLSSPPKQLQEHFQQRTYSRVVFADVCKDGAGMPLAAIAISLNNSSSLKSPWTVIGAANTYNPLSRIITFLSQRKILDACLIK